MNSRLNPYINFADTARQAMAFYKEVFGGELTLNTFEEYGMAEDPADADKIMHAALTTDNGTVIMAADTPHSLPAPVPGTTMSLSLSGTDEAELRGYWDKLSDGGKITMQLAPQIWGDIFGMCVDKFGIHWMINITAAGVESA
jgi:PhnB protein